MFCSLEVIFFRSVLSLFSNQLSTIIDVVSCLSHASPSIHAVRVELSFKLLISKPKIVDIVSLPNFYIGHSWFYFGLILRIM